MSPTRSTLKTDLSTDKSDLLLFVDRRNMSVLLLIKPTVSMKSLIFLQFCYDSRKTTCVVIHSPLDVTIVQKIEPEGKTYKCEMRRQCVL